MRKRTAAAWIGITLVLAAGTSLLRQTQAIVAAKPANVATDEVERESGKGTQEIAASNPVQRQDVEHTQTDVEEHVQRIAVRSMLTTALPSLPLPSRVLPGPPPTSEQAAPGRQGHLLPMPPVPSKTPPGPIPEGAENNSSAVDGTEPIDPC